MYTLECYRVSNDNRAWVASGQFRDVTTLLGNLPKLWALDYRIIAPDGDILPILWKDDDEGYTVPYVEQLG